MPFKYFLIKRFLILVFFPLVLFRIGGIALGQSTDAIVWQRLETKHTIICYQSLDDLKKFDAKIKYKIEFSGLMGLFSSSRSKDLLSTVSKKVDALFERALEILDMRKKMDKVTINVYHGNKQLHDAYQKIYMRPCRIRAWYEYGFNTVYMNIDDMHEGMLAHEMAHSIIDHYLLVRPPAATAEILARYVDSHLRK